MATMIQFSPVDLGADQDLVSAFQWVFENSSVPLPLHQVRAALPDFFRPFDPDYLADFLRRQVAANVFYLFPRYRSQHLRYWHRPLRVHLENLLVEALGQEALAWNDIRRRLPDYAKMSAEAVLEDLLIKGRIFRHPPTSSRMGPRYGTTPPEVQRYAGPQFQDLVARLKDIGFDKAQIRRGLLDLFEQWDQQEE